MTKTKKIVLIGLFAALTVVVGYVLLAVPNVELVTATIFIGGYLLGPYAGCAIGTVGEFLYALVNPLGMSSPPLLVAQVLSMAIVGLIGGWFGQRKFWPENSPLRFLIFAVTGVVLTLVFDILTTLSFAPFVAGWNIKKIVVIFFSGVPFYITHWIVNFIIFGTIVPMILLALKNKNFEYE